jgi:hypothetical protein
MHGEQFFVGGVAMMLGFAALLAAFQNHDRYYQLPKIRWVDERWGRGTARAAYVFLGACFLALGIFVFLGMHPRA